MQEKQPGYVLKFKAKPGKGDELFKVCTDLHYNGEPDGPVDWVLSQSLEDPDILWAFEFYRDDASFDRHYSNPALDDGCQFQKTTAFFRRRLRVRRKHHH